MEHTSPQTPARIQNRQLIVSMSVMKEASLVVRLVDCISIFDNLSEQEKNQIEPYALHHKVEAGKNVFQQGKRGEHLYFIHNGSVSIFLDKILYIARKGDYIGEMAILSRDQIHQFSARTLEPSELISIPRACFVRLFEENKNAKVVLRMLANAYERIQTSFIRIDDSGGESLIPIVRMLCEYVDLKAYTPVSGGGFRINENLEELFIADRCSCSRSTVARNLKFLSKKKIISKIPRTGIITIWDLDGLRSYLIR
jgi:CRP-like cAMP-binding protein